MPKSHWNYRIVRHRGSKDEGDTLCIHEVHYEEGKPVLCTDRGACVVSETEKGIGDVLNKMRKAMDKPILDAKDFGVG